MQHYLFVTPALDATAEADGVALATFTERHYFKLPPIGYAHLTGTVLDAALKAPGTVLVLDRGLPNRAQLSLSRELISRGRRVLYYWPAEHAVEVIDGERLDSMRRHHRALFLATRFRALMERRRQKAMATTLTQHSAAPIQALADSGVVRATVEHMGREAESLETHLKGGIAELRRGLGAVADQFGAHAGALAVQLDAAHAALAGMDGHPAKSAVNASIGALAEVTATVGSLRGYRDSIASYVEGGLPVLDRIRQQSESAAADVARIAAPAVQAAAVPVDGSSAYGEAEVPAVHAFLRAIAEDPRPVPLRLDHIPSDAAKLPGIGMYLRLDFWAPLISGGSYGHTCYQAQALAETTQDFVSVTSNRFDLLDDLGVRQVTVPGRNMTQTELNILGMNRHYTERLGVLFDAMRPTYIFERAVLGSAVGAWASRRFNIPYIVEYNGSEISMKRSFAGEGYAHEDLLLLAEDAAFRQASLISVVSDHVAADVARRGIPESRILVNPNAVDLNAYAPASAAQRRLLRSNLGFADDHRVVGFIGTFGGWHGIDVLASSLNDIMQGNPSIRYLLIGDGNLKPQINEAIAAHGLQDRVVDVGRVPQARGAELLKACDILVSPHSRNMVDSPFFGSPTKLFEYMAMGVGIVASDLEQIAHVLAPALRPQDFSAGAPAVTDQRAVICKPGDVQDFVAGVLALARHPQVSAALGRNARDAAEKYYSWRQHVRNLWLTMAGKSAEGYAVDRRIGLSR
jgi:glycosyltransferase involved in cell wall biosynthesis